MTPLQSVEGARAKLYDLASRLTADKDLREDLVSEMTLFLLERWEELHDKPDAYIFRACYRHAIDVLRKGRSIDSKQRSGVVVESLCALCERLGVDECLLACSVNGTDDPEAIFSAKCLMRELLARLTPVQREVLLMLLEGYRPSEIATKRGVSKATVSKSLRSIQKILSLLMRS
ncbi:MAG: sigma-70 family RNA polymerase sigma factor [Armatimonadetes bacterium]|nr:sigma-70 family RNA polymerase sigma factor [Armatimonadota bacterium]MDW8027296.1 sigma-70 family RNA polymerase sigma factor [Armatimonadota bacterium]